MEKMSNSRRERSASDPSAWLLQQAGNLECCLSQGWIPPALQQNLPGRCSRVPAGHRHRGHGVGHSAMAHAGGVALALRTHRATAALPTLPQGELWHWRGLWDNPGAAVLQAWLQNPGHSRCRKPGICGVSRRLLSSRGKGGNRSAFKAPL